MRRSIIVGNWKMNMLISSAGKWIDDLLEKLHFADSVDIVVAPPFTALAKLRESVKDSRIYLAGQNMGSEIEGPRTGEISAAMLKDAGCDYVILGHSERRKYFTETDDIIGRKISIACNHELNVIFCIGETLEERNNGLTNEVIETQLAGGLAGLGFMELGNLIVAYEPVWAIGSGYIASPEQAQEVHLFTRTWIQKSFGRKYADAIRILYGGSVKHEASKTLMNQLDIDGLLVGGASLNSDSFGDIIKSLD